MAQNINQKLPLECTNIDEVRSEIDHIDYEIIRLLATRTEYVSEVVKYKQKNGLSIEAPNRRNAVLKSRSEWAEQAGISPDVIEDIYNKLIDYYIQVEKKLIQ